jgi:Type II CAAX prenyl endopeptidase Rce1-like
VKRPAFWIVLALVSVSAVFVAVKFFPLAFSIVALDIKMDRQRALDEARAIVTRDTLGPSGSRQAASFALDDDAQTFVELEGGGKDAFTGMLRSRVYSAYTWRVRHFKEGETNEATIRFTPEGQPYGFVEQLREDAPGAALAAAAARQIAESAAVAKWHVDLTPFTLVEQGQERRVGGRVDHTLTYERPTPVLNEGRFRLRLVVSGDRLTEVTHFVRIPEAFTRRYANMRSANEAIGVGSVVAMALLYIIGGIGIGLFFMLRQRWVIWRPAMLWGAAVGLMQALAILNEFPLLWLTYDTAVPRSTFLAQQAATVVASFVGFSVFFGLSFMAAETLSRRAFPHHPQLWGAWSKRSADGGRNPPGASTAMLGRTVGGYLLVSVFLAYDVMLYFFATKYLGWWSPSEALLHPDVLAAYVPWLSAIANSFQAGFWEEALFRAVPLAGAALIGERFGQRRLFLVLAFIVQTVVFGAGHAPYPAMPSYVRPVELIIPSIGFGLLYVYFGLLPGIVLHYAFDAVLFALPIFVADAPGIWLQQVMVAVFVLVPLGVVLWRRVQIGHWHELSPADRNAAWKPPAAAERIALDVRAPQATLGARTRTAWLAAGAAGLIFCVFGLTRVEPNRLPIERERAAALARGAIEARRGALEPRWRVMTAPDNGNGGAHEFVSRTAGEPRRKELVGLYLPGPRWRVRVATFQGDVADRAEEWHAYVTPSGEVRGVQHTLPEARPGASLDEATARRTAQAAVAERFSLDAARGQVKEVSARPLKQKARTDWTFTFVDTMIAPLPQGEPRITVDIAGDEVAAVSRFVYVPEEWQRQERAAETRGLILRIADTLVFAGVLVAAAVAGVVAWSRRRFAPSVFLIGAALMLLISLCRSVNNAPTVLFALPTAAPLQLQLVGIIGIGVVGLALSATMVGLVLGATPQRLSSAGTLADRDALRLGIAGGLVAAAVAALAGWLRVPEWGRLPNLDAAGTLAPILQAALDPLPRVLMASAIVLATVLAVDQFTSGWTRRRVAGAALLAVVGFAAGGVPAGVSAGGWIAAGGLTAAALVVTYVTLLRLDPTLVPLTIGIMSAIAAIGQAAQRPYPGALAGSAVGAILAAGLGWWWCRILRRARARVTSTSSTGQGVAATS